MAWYVPVVTALSIKVWLIGIKVTIKNVFATNPPTPSMVSDPEEQSTS